jgi:hypothetical protein
LLVVDAKGLSGKMCSTATPLQPRQNKETLFISPVLEKDQDQTQKKGNNLRRDNSLTTAISCGNTCFLFPCLSAIAFLFPTNFVGSIKDSKPPTNDPHSLHT